MKEILIELFERDLEKLKSEILLYKKEATIWAVDNEIKNSAGNLCLHIAGNLRAFIGGGLANIDYVRDRDFEFNGKGVSRDELLSRLDLAKKVAVEGLQTLDETKLESDFPILIWKEKRGMVFTLLHLHAHLTYHLGQVNYHRRLLS